MALPTTIELDKEKIMKQLLDLSSIGARDKWKLEYDSELDELVFGKAKMPDGSFLFYVNDEINLFVMPDSTVNGIFVEYFAHNYIEHNQELKPALEVLEDRHEAGNGLAKEALEERLLREAAGSILGRKKLTAAI